MASSCELACFSLVGVGFGVYHPEALICGYVVATLFAMISVTPQGVGVVEAAVLVAFTSFGVSSAAGMAIALVYRGIVFWFPFLVGAILIQTTKTFRHEAKKTVRAHGKRDALHGVERTAKRLDEVKKGAQPLPCPPKDARTPMRAASRAFERPCRRKGARARPPHPPYERRG